MRFSPLSFCRIAIIASVLLAQFPPVYAQEEMHPAATESIRLQVGDIFEILPVHDIADATYTWILTQDRTFLEASRAPSFRKRLIQPGTYTLYAEIASADGSRRITRTVALEYAARQPGQAGSGTLAASGDLLVYTEPAANADGKIAMTTGKQLVRLNPINPDITPLALDLDLSRDANGDGINDNDIQSGDTFFHSDATPLYLWITDEPLTTHAISVTAALPDGARTQKLEILSEELALAQGAVRSPVHIDVEQTGERTYTFTAVFDNPATAAGQLLYQWQFGDGEESLMTKADHTYATDGTYEVSLLIRNLRDGSDIASTSMAVNVAGGSVVPSSESSSESSETPPDSGSGYGIGSILMLVGLFLGSILIGILIIVLIGKFRKGRTSLADKLESIEQTVVKTPTQETAPLTIAPPSATAETKRVSPPPSIAEREKELAAERPAVPPAPKLETTPAWLNAPTAAKNTPTAPAPAQIPKPAAPVTSAPQAPKPAPAPASAPVQTPTTPKPAAAPTTPAAPARPSAPPTWLQPPTPAQQKPAPAPAATPAPVQTPTPTPKPEAAPVTPPAPVQKPAPAPAAMAPPRSVATDVAPTPVVQPMNPPTPPVSPVPVTPPPAPAPAVVQPTPVIPPTPAPPVPPATGLQEMDIPPASDQPIAIIRAESLNPPEAENH